MEGLAVPVHYQIRAIFMIALQFIENGQTNPISYDLKYVISNFKIRLVNHRPPIIPSDINKISIT